MAAAAVAVAGLVTYTALSLNHGRNTVTTSQTSVTVPQDRTLPATLGWLSRAAIADPDALERVLIDSSPQLLLRVDRPGGALAALAKE